MDHFRKGWHASGDFTYIKFDVAVGLIIILSLKLEIVIKLTILALRLDPSMIRSWYVEVCSESKYDSRGCNDPTRRL